MINLCFCWSSGRLTSRFATASSKVIFDINVSDSAPLGRMCPSIMYPKSVQLRGSIPPIQAFLLGSSSEARVRARARANASPVQVVSTSSTEYLYTIKSPKAKKPKPSKSNPKQFTRKMYARSDLHPDMTGSERYRKRASGVHVNGAYSRNSSTKLPLTENRRGLTGRRCPFWLGAQCLTRRNSG